MRAGTNRGMNADCKGLRFQGLTSGADFTDCSAVDKIRDGGMVDALAAGGQEVDFAHREGLTPAGRMLNYMVSGRFPHLPRIVDTRGSVAEAAHERREPPKGELWRSAGECPLADGCGAFEDGSGASVVGWVRVVE